MLICRYVLVVIVMGAVSTPADHPCSRYLAPASSLASLARQENLFTRTIDATINHLQGQMRDRTASEIMWKAKVNPPEHRPVSELIEVLQADRPIMADGNIARSYLRSFEETTRELEILRRVAVRSANALEWGADVRRDQIIFIPTTYSEPWIAMGQYEIEKSHAGNKAYRLVEAKPPGGLYLPLPVGRGLIIKIYMVNSSSKLSDVFISILHEICHGTEAGEGAINDLMQTVYEGSQEDLQTQLLDRALLELSRENPEMLVRIIRDAVLTTLPGYMSPETTRRHRELEVLLESDTVKISELLPQLKMLYHVLFPNPYRREVEFVHFLEGFVGREVVAKAKHQRDMRPLKAALGARYDILVDLLDMFPMGSQLRKNKIGNKFFFNLATAITSKDQPAYREVSREGRHRRMRWAMPRVFGAIFTYKNVSLDQLLRLVIRYVWLSLEGEFDEHLARMVSGLERHSYASAIVHGTFLDYEDPSGEAI